MNLFLLLETEGRPEGRSVVGAHISPYCSVLTLCLANTSSLLLAYYQFTFKTSQTIDKESFEADNAAKYIKASAEILKRV